MSPEHASAEQQSWLCSEFGHRNIVVQTIGGPEEGPDVIPCPTVVGNGPDGNERFFHVAMKLDEIELAHLARGGTLWLTTWGHLPIHLVHVQPPEDR